VTVVTNTCENEQLGKISTSMQEHLCKLLLEFSSAGQERKQDRRAKLPLSQEELVELIGTTRETVTRTPGESKNQNLGMIQGSTLLIHNRPALQNLVAA